MNQNYLESIISYFNLGPLKQKPKRIHGGLLHTMWCLETSEGVYAIKQLSLDIDLSNKVVVNNYNLTEEIASRFIQQGIPAVCAIKLNARYLYQLDNLGFFVYPWVNAKALDKDAINTEKALEIAAILSKIHAINLEVPEILEPEFNVHTTDKIIALANKAIEFACPFSNMLNENLQAVLIANKHYKNAIPILKSHLVVSHGDLDQKNVLWDERGNPILIDWESARKLNPTYEMVDAALNWSGITTGFNVTLFSQMIEVYKRTGGIIDETSFEASFSGVLGNWINWMVYNIERACNGADLEQRQLGIEQVILVLPILLRLMDLIPKLNKINEG